jgi:hypothetical protein
MSYTLLLLLLTILHSAAAAAVNDTAFSDVSTILSRCYSTSADTTNSDHYCGVSSI